MRRGATLVEALIALGIGLLALVILFTLSRQVQRHDTRLDAAATRIQAVAHLRDALSMDLAQVAAPEVAGKPTLAISEQGALLTILTARRLSGGQVKLVPIEWRFEGGRLTRAGQPLATTGLDRVTFASGEDAEPAVTLTAFDARGPVTLRLPAGESAAGLDGFVPATSPIQP